MSKAKGTKGILREYAYIPIDLLKDDLDKTKVKLTVIPMAFDKKEPDPIPLYDLSYQSKGYIGVPYDWGLTNYSHLKWIDKTTKGSKVKVRARKKIDPNHPLAPKGQEEFTKKIYETLKSNYTCLAVADTGTGKTVVSLDIISKFKCRTLIVVDTLDLANQWKDRAKTFLGLKDSEVAIVNGKKGENLTAQICIGVVQSLSANKYTKKFYSSFGMTVFDEVHTMAASTFSKLFGLLRSTYNLGVTATPDRLDGSEIVYYNWLGKAAVTSKAKCLPVHVYRVEYTSRPLYGNNKAIMLNQIAKDQKRNRLIRDIILQEYNNDKEWGKDQSCIIVLSDRISQLKDLKELCEAMGVDPKDTCMYVGSYEENGKKITLDIVKRKKMRDTKRIFFATFKLAEKGMDIPRLNVGIDATPRSQAKQALGRTSRIYKEKKYSKWYTIDDIHVPKFRSNYYSRLKDYSKLGAKIKNYVPRVSKK